MSVSSRLPDAPRTLSLRSVSYARHSFSAVHARGGALIASASALMSWNESRREYGCA